MTNLLQETRQAARDPGHTERDIMFIGSLDSGHNCTWAQFEKLAEIDYDADFSQQNVACDLVIDFPDGTRLGRADYDAE